MNMILLKNVSYLNIEKEKIEDNYDILIENNKISKISSKIDIKADKIIDCSGKLAVPAYTNGHTHLGMTMMRNLADDLDLNTWLNEKIWPVEDKLTSEDIYWASMLSIVENIKSGVGTVYDMYYSMDRVSDGIIESGIRGVLTRGMMDISGGGDERIDELLELYKNYHNSGNGRVKIVPAPHSIYTCSKEYLIKLMDIAASFDGVINTHLSETKKEVEDCLKEHSTTPAKYLNDLGMFDLKVVAAHCVHLTDEEIDLISEKDVYPIYNPSSNLKLASGFAPIDEMLKKGIKLGIGTDGSSSNNNQDLIEEMHIGSIVNKAVTLDATSVPAIEILKMATLNGGKLTGFNNGIIVENALADIALYDLNALGFTPKNNMISALCYSTNSNYVTDLIVDGKVIMENREILTVDEEKIKYEVNRLTEKLLKR
ncbi:amidohydrolase [Anaerosphaera multitolerans]|uniref:5-methylthioadenosine/S-adenosylhomocysteine deaminase n=2 Tax=Anaerosphaera multitolerans TaxID=2487351 RepID=A0A437S783_9FIRM|nr:amidohydrolase [Anaerosphaera multitolerans]RVU54910.1 amidohydrolase [Anaerosphaera multitolerans]